MVNLFNQADIPARFVNATIEQYSNFSGNGGPVLQKIIDYIERFQDSGQKGLLIGGPVGVGKTYLLIGIARKLLEAGFSVKYADYFQLLHSLRASYSQANDKDEGQILEPFAKVDVLILDEFAKSRGSDWELTVLDQLVMARYNSGKALIAATNYRLNKGATSQARLEPLDQSPLSKAPGSFSPDQFEMLEQKVGQRIYSRLREMTEFLELRAIDYRPIFS